MWQIPIMEETAEEDDVSDIPDHLRLPGRVREDNDRQGWLHNMDI